MDHASDTVRETSVDKHRNLTDGNYKGSDYGNDRNNDFQY